MRECRDYARGDWGASTEASAWDVYEAVDSRRAVRASNAQPVSKQVPQRVLQPAARAPSSGNLQPWRLIVAAGEPLAKLKRMATAQQSTQSRPRSDVAFEQLVLER